MQNLFRVFLVVLLFGFLAMSVEASVVKIESDFSALHVGDVFTVDLAVDTERQTINAADVAVTFPSELLDYVGSDDGESVINLWVSQPIFDGKGAVTFSGITPGGFSDRAAKLLTLMFKVKAVGQGNIEINQATLLMHDGLGTEAQVTKQNWHLAVSEGASEIVVNTIDDEIPESFTPEVIQDIDVFAGAHTLIFATEDKGSGIDYYEVKEGWFGLYHQAASPYILPNQALDKKITIKAVDRLGNERVEIFYPQNWQPWNQHILLNISILTLCALSLFVLVRRFAIWPKK